jgi:hypothetical protein
MFFGLIIFIEQNKNMTCGLKHKNAGNNMADVNK